MCRELRASSLQCENDTVETAGEIFGSSLIVVVLYVLQELRSAGLFCQCVLVCRGYSS